MARNCVGCGANIQAGQYCGNCPESLAAQGMAVQNPPEDSFHANKELVLGRAMLNSCYRRLFSNFKGSDEARIALEDAFQRIEDSAATFRVYVDTLKNNGL